MNRTRVQYFLSLADTLNFSETARIFHISQPALSKAIRKLEDELGGAVIRREGRLTHLTPLGRAMVTRLKDIEHASLRAEQEAKRLTGHGRAQFEISVMCTVSVRRIAPFLHLVHQRLPHVELILHDTSTDQVESALLSGHCDLAILATPFGQHERLRHIELYREDMVVACALDHRFATRDQVDLKELQDQPYVERSHCEFRDLFFEECRVNDVAVMPVLRSAREDWVSELVSQGQGITVMPSDSVDRTRMAQVGFGPKPLWRSVSIAVATGREDNDIVRAFLAQARTYDWLSAP